MGVWIETSDNLPYYYPNDVTPFVGVWIETLAHVNDDKKTPVTPFVGVWIETSDVNQPTRRTGSHTLRGCVD